MPNLSFSGLHRRARRGGEPRTDDRLTTSYSGRTPSAGISCGSAATTGSTRPAAEINSNARGSFTFTGLYSSGGAPVAGQSGADFADFLLGVPQQATLQVGGRHPPSAARASTPTSKTTGRRARS